MNLRLSCWAEGLKKADALAVLTVLATSSEDDANKGTSRPRLLGQTEVISKTTSPDWTKTFLYGDYELGDEAINVVVSLYDDNGKKQKRPIGSVLFEIGTVMASPGAVMAKELKNGAGMVALRVEEANEAAGQLHVQLRGLKLKNLDGLGLGLMNKSDPFFEILRARKSKQRTVCWDAVYRSKTLDNNLSPIWPEVFLDLDLLGTDIEEAFRVSVLNENRNGSHDLIGSVDLTVQDLLENVNDTVFRETSKIDTTKSFTLKDGNEETGKLLVVKADVSGLPEAPREESAPTTTEQEKAVESAVPAFSQALGSGDGSTDEIAIEPTFVNYVAGGCELRVIVAIDVTKSNGNPREETSLHYLNGNNGRNDYEAALQAICTASSKFDSDQLYPVFGFGAVRENGGAVSHCFPMGTEPVKQAEGVDGILKAYRETMSSGIDMSQPRNFAEVIKEAAKDAKRELVSHQSEYSTILWSRILLSCTFASPNIAPQSSLKICTKQNKAQAYSILLIFTNGGPNNNNIFESCKAALKEADDAPLSVVIMGLGKGGGFANSKKLAEPVAGSRHKVTFVRYQRGQKAVAKAALHSIPKQLENYFISKHMDPQPESDSEEISVEPHNEGEDIDLPLVFDDAGGVALSRGVEVQAPRGNPGGPRKNQGRKNNNNRNRRKMKKNNDPLGLNKIKGVKEARMAMNQVRQIKRQARQAKNLFNQVGKLFN